MHPYLEQTTIVYHKVTDIKIGQVTLFNSEASDYRQQSLLTIPTPTSQQLQHNTSKNVYAEWLLPYVSQKVSRHSHIHQGLEVHLGNYSIAYHRDTKINSVLDNSQEPYNAGLKLISKFYRINTMNSDH